jgi:protein-disulfide isomerase
VKLLSIIVTSFLVMLSPVLHAEFVNIPGLGSDQPPVNPATDNGKATLIGNNSMALLHDANDPVGGNIKGKVTLVEFFDYQCIHCIASDPIVNTIAKNNADLRIVYKEYPIAGAISTFAAKVALAANKQGKYFATHEALMHMGTIGITEAKILELAKAIPLDMDKLKKDMDSKEIDDQLKGNFQIGSLLGITGTPAFIGAPTDLFGVNPNAFLSIGEGDLQKLQDLLSKIKI